MAVNFDKWRQAQMGKTGLYVMIRSANGTAPYYTHDDGREPMIQAQEHERRNIWRGADDAIVSADRLPVLREQWSAADCATPSGAWMLTHLGQPK